MINARGLKHTSILSKDAKKFEMSTLNQEYLVKSKTPVAEAAESSFN